MRAVQHLFVDGFAGGTPVAVDFDLGDDAHGISDIEIGCLRQMEYGIGLAGSVTLYASADGESYTSLGAVYMPASPQDPAKFTYAFRLDETLKARYIRLAFSKQEAGWFFIDEISAYAYSADNAPEQGTVAQYYGDPTVPAAEPSYWPETDADYDETLNLALGAEHIYVQHFSELEPEDAVPSLNTPDPAVLIDGTRAGVSWSGADTFRMTRGDGRRITIDLGHISAVERVAFDLLILTSWGVYPSARSACWSAKTAPTGSPSRRCGWITATKPPRCCASPPTSAASAAPATSAC